jgi:hypothetical protein
MRRSVIMGKHNGQVEKPPGHSPIAHGDAPARGVSLPGGGEVAVWRKIYRDILASEDVQSLPDGAKWMFIGLILEANDSGEVSATVKWLKWRIWGVKKTKNCTLWRFLELLKERKMVLWRRLEPLKGKREIVIHCQITNFGRFQASHKKRRDEMRGDERRNPPGKTYRQKAKEEAQKEEEKLEAGRRRRDQEQRDYRAARDSAAMDPADFGEAVKDAKDKFGRNGK